MRRFKAVCLSAGFLFAQQALAAAPALAAKSEKLSLSSSTLISEQQAASHHKSESRFP